MSDKKTYFLSDAHLGAPYIKDAKAHEAHLVAFLNSVKPTAKEIYFLGDIFDFWYEWHHVIPKGFARFQGKIAELVDSGIKIHFFGGNHDMWMYGYFEDELGVILHHEPEIIRIDEKTFFLAHGEDLGVDDKLFKAMIYLFRSPIIRWVFSTFVPPNSAMRLAKGWSKKSRSQHDKRGSTKYFGEDKEHLVKFAKNYQGNEHIDYFIFGHRHILLDLMIKKETRVIILGEWIKQYSYAEVKDGQLSLSNYDV